MDRRSWNIQQEAYSKSYTLQFGPVFMKRFQKWERKEVRGLSLLTYTSRKISIHSIIHTPIPLIQQIPSVSPGCGRALHLH